MEEGLQALTAPTAGSPPHGGGLPPLRWTTRHFSQDRLIQFALVTIVVFLVVRRLGLRKTHAIALIRVRSVDRPFASTAFARRCKRTRGMSILTGQTS